MLFFARILYANNVVLARGHYNAHWRLTTSYERAAAAGTLERDLRAADRFVEQLLASDEVRECYAGPIPENHIAAILQHYGFPTQLLDFTYSLDVALYFAEGGHDYLPVSESLSAIGAIYVIPSWMSNNAVLTVLPPGIMRPSLQRGVFLKTNPSARAGFEEFRYTFRHLDLPVWNGISDITFGAAAGLGRYLFPASDPIYRISLRAREID